MTKKCTIFLIYSENLDKEIKFEYFDLRVVMPGSA